MTHLYIYIFDKYIIISQIGFLQHLSCSVPSKEKIANIHYRITSTDAKETNNKTNIVLCSIWPTKYT